MQRFQRQLRLSLSLCRFRSFRLLRIQARCQERRAPHPWKIRFVYLLQQMRLSPCYLQVKASGKVTTSRDARLDFLYEQFVTHFQPGNAVEAPKQEAPKNAVPTATPEQAFEAPKAETKNELPF